LELPKESFRSSKEKRQLAVNAEQERNKEDPRNKWLWQLLRMFPQISLPRPASQEQRSEQQGSSQPSHGIVMATVLSGNAGDCDIARAQRSHVSAKNCNRKWGPVAPSSEVSEEARLVEMNVCFIAGTGNERR